MAGVSDHKIAREFGPSHQSVGRHRTHHLPTPAMRVAIAARENDEGARGLNLIDSANETRLRMADILDKAENDHDWRAAVAAGRTMIAALEFIAKMQGDITDATTVNVLVSPALAQLQEVVLAALARHPAARADVIAALAAVNGPALLEHVPLAT